MSRKLFLFAALLVAIGCSVVPLQRLYGRSTGDLAKGRAVYTAQGCYLCHGYAGQGARSTGPALVPLTLSDSGFHRYLRSPSGAMPAYSAKLLPPPDVVLVRAYIRSLSPGRPASRIPLLARYAAGRLVRPAQPERSGIIQAVSNSQNVDMAEGRRLYLAHCSACHGVDRWGGSGPDLQAERTKRTGEQTVRVLLAPPPGMPKLSPHPLSVGQMRAIAEYIRAPD